MPELPSASDTFYGLAACGFIKLNNHALWQERKAREFSLTFEPMNDREPTDEWEKWTPDNSYPVPGPKKIPTQKTGAALLKNQGQTAKESGAVVASLT